MEKYVNQLVDKIREAVLRANNEGRGTEKEFDGVDMLGMEVSDEKPMSVWFGLDPSIFPSSDQLNDEQVDLLTTEFYSLWEAFHFWPDFPELLPNRRRYDLMVKKMETDVQYWPVGTWFIEFCEYDPENCPFGEDYCWCRTESSS